MQYYCVLLWRNEGSDTIQVFFVGTTIAKQVFDILSEFRTTDGVQEEITHAIGKEEFLSQVVQQKIGGIGLNTGSVINN